MNMKIIPISDVVTTEGFFLLDDHINTSGHQQIASTISKHLQILFHPQF